MTTYIAGRPLRYRGADYKTGDVVPEASNMSVRNLEGHIANGYLYDAEADFIPQRVRERMKPEKKKTRVAKE